VGTGNGTFKPDWAFAPVTYLDNLEMLVQCFPYDRYLPTVATVIERPIRDLLTALWPTRTFDKNAIDRWCTEPMRYRPQHGATLKVWVEEDDITPSEPMYLKIYRQGEARSAFEFLRSSYELNRGNPYYTLVEPTACIDSFNAVALRQAAGDPFDTILHKGRQVVESANIVAKALTQFHCHGAVASRQRDAEGFLERGPRATKLLTWSDPDIGARADQLLLKLTPTLSFELKRATHLDIKPDHLLIDNNGATLIDIDSSAMSDPIADVAMLIVRLEAMRVVDGLSAGVVERAKEAFLNSYCSVVNKEDLCRLPAHIGLALLKVGLFYMQHQTPNWQARVTGLMDTAMDSFSS